MIRTWMTKSHILLLLALGLGISNIVQSRALYVARDELLKQRQIVQGEVITSLPCQTPEGHTVERPLENGVLPTIIYWYTENCHWCKQNLENIQAIARSSENRYRLRMVTTDEPDQASLYLSSIGIPSESLCTIDDASDMRRQLGSTPKTILLAPDGEVLHAWRGAFTARIHSRIQKQLGIILPKVVEAPARRRPTK